MSKLRDKIIEASTQLGVTSYEYGKNTSLSQPGAGKVLDRTSKKPSGLTLNEMKTYLIERYGVSKDWLEKGLGPMIYKEDVVALKKEEEYTARLVIFHMEKWIDQLMDNKIRSMERKLDAALAKAALSETR